MKLLVIDGNSVLNRAFYGIKLLSTHDGMFTNAIFGFLNILLNLSEECKPDATAITFDVKAPTFRHEFDAAYKATRKPMPAELLMQVQPLKELLGALGYVMVEKAGFEADDLIGTLAAACEARGDDCVIATGDRDSLQLISPHVSVRLTATFSGKSQSTVYGEREFFEKYGTTPEHLIDIKALMGDSSDNVPGVAGIGEKTALQLIGKYQTVENIYEQLDTLEATASVKNKLAAGKDAAFRSKYLVTIRRDVPMDTDPEHYRKCPMNRAEAYRQFMKLEMPSMIQRLNLWDAAEAAAPQKQEKKKFYVCRLTEETAAELQKEERLCAHAVFSEDSPVFVSFVGAERAWIAEHPDAAFIQKVLLPFHGSFVTDDCKKWYKWALKEKITLPEVTFDVVLSAYLTDPSQTDYSLEKILLMHTTPATDFDNENVENYVESVKNSLSLPALADTLSAQIDKNEQHSLLCDMEIPLAEVLSDMELCGFSIDTDAVKAFGEELTERIDRLEEEIYETCGERFNINSPKQLGDILFVKLALPGQKKTKSGYSTNAEVLERLRGEHPAVDRVLEYRKLTKLKSTYVDGLLKAVRADGKIHTTFNQTETRTGRISSLEPNMQNIPVRTEEGSRLRAFFHASEGCLLADADYSQIELRVLAALADDRNMISAFRDGKDIHTATAAQVFGLPEEFITPQLRSRAKAVNFGIVYGIGAFSLSKDIGVSVKEADSYIRGYLDTYSGVERYMKHVVEQAAADGYVTTLFHRRRYLPELKSSNHMVKAAGERMARNTPIQGTAADIIKIAMVKVYRRLKAEKMASKLIMQVHDELILECPQAELSRAKALLKEEMEHAVALSVAMSVEVSSGKTWLEAK